MAPSPDAGRSRLPLLLGFAAWSYLLMGFEGVQRPYVGRSFALDDAGIAQLVGWVQVGVLGAFVALWQADRRGRRWLLLLSLAALPPLALATAAAPGLAWFLAAQIGVTAFTRALFGIVPVVLTEEAAEGQRPRLQAWYGMVSILGAMGGLLVLSVLLSGRWRLAWVLAALPWLALPFVRRALGETQRFARARAVGRAEAVQLWHVFGGPYARRAAGLLVASTLRGAAVMAALSWTYYHSIENLGLSEALAAGLSLGATLGGLVGVPLAARLCERWGRRPTVVLGSSLAIGAGVVFYWLPAGGEPGSLGLLFAVLALSHLGMNIFNVGDRLVDTEIFPTHLRATFTAWGRLGDAVSGIAGNLALSALSAALGGLVPAISVLAPACFVPAVALFLWAVPETRGLDLETASLDR